MMTVLFFVSVCALVLLSMPAFSQSSAQTVPENASAKGYGDGWRCNVGYKLDGDVCAEIFVPENGFKTNHKYGLGWECLHGFYTSDEAACVAVVVPQGGFQAIEDECNSIEVPLNAYLNTASYGKPWTCERGYFEQDGLCEAVVIPTHAYFDDATYGNGWKCDRGYAASGDSCYAIEMPMNAHLDRSGNRWECDKSFRRSKGQCVLNN